MGLQSEPEQTFPHMNQTIAVSPFSSLRSHEFFIPSFSLSCLPTDWVHFSGNWCVWHLTAARRAAETHWIKF